MSLSVEDAKYHETATAEIAATESFLKGFLKRRKDSKVTVIDAFDGCCAEAAVSHLQPCDFLPKNLLDIFDSVGENNRASILGAIELGIQGYQNAHGGDLPRADMVAAALSAGKLAVDEFDSANGTQLNSAGMEANAVVPAAAIVTIATRIANAMPLVAYLPNQSGSNAVPIIYGRNIAKHTFGAVKSGDYLDGPNASLQYFDAQFEFVAEKDATVATKYTLSPTVAYLPDADRKPKTDAKPLPFMGGRVRILVNGVEVGNDGTVNHAKFDGESSIIPVRKHNLTVLDENDDEIPVVLKSGTADLTNNTVTFEFENELPESAEVSVKLIADYERKIDNIPVLTAPSLDVDLIAREVMAYPMRATYRATREAINQMQRELGVDMQGGVTAVVASKFQLEQNIRLLKDAKRRAIGYRRTMVADLSRGATDTAAFNNTAEQARELLVTISAAKVSINKLLDIVPSGHDIYVTDKMAVLFDNLADDTHYRKITNAVGSPNQIVRIGVIGSNTNVYHVPEESELLKEVDNSAEIMIIGRSGEAVRNPFVGFVTMPLLVRQSGTVDFEDGVTIQTVQAAELNPLDRFSDQVYVINIVNLPISLIGK